MTLPPFQELLDAHGRDVHRFLVASVGGGDADDCYQETWLAALRAYPRLRDARNLRGWLLTIAHRKAIDHARGRRRAAVPAGELPEVAAAAGAATAEAAPGLTVRAAAASRGEDGDIWGLVRRLPAKQRTAVALRYVVDADYSVIADAMGTTQEAARRNVHEGLKRLRTEYR